jgi:transcription initiation factor TFIIIB Brf1 subunit/transcription initiation factor TFIIB
MFGVELICTEEDCPYVVETTVWTLEQADALVCEDCECTLQVTAVWDSVEVRASAAVAGAGAPDVIAA